MEVISVGLVLNEIPMFRLRSWDYEGEDDSFSAPLVQMFDKDIVSDDIVLILIHPAMGNQMDCDCLV